MLRKNHGRANVNGWIPVAVVTYAVLSEVCMYERTIASRLRASVRFSDISLLRVVHVPKPEMNIMAQENKQIHERYREHVTGNAARLSLQAQRKETELPKINGSEAKWLQGTIANSNGGSVHRSNTVHRIYIKLTSCCGSACLNR